MGFHPAGQPWLLVELESLSLEAVSVGQPVVAALPFPPCLLKLALGRSREGRAHIGWHRSVGSHFLLLHLLHQSIMNRLQ